MTKHYDMYKSCQNPNFPTTYNTVQIVFEVEVIGIRMCSVLNILWLQSLIKKQYKIQGDISSKKMRKMCMGEAILA